jgi:hypothetical protein
MGAPVWGVVGWVVLGLVVWLLAVLPPAGVDCPPGDDVPHAADVATTLRARATEARRCERSVVMW